MNPKNVWFTSDHHFGHENIIKLTKRPFNNISQMEEAFITYWNENIKSNDIVYYLGDFSYRYKFKENNIIKLLKTLHGTKHLIIGNHDKELLKYLNNNNIVDMPFSTIEYLNIIKFNKIKITLCHYPMLKWDGSNHGHIQLHGHCHGTKKIILKNSMDIGVDCNNYKPWSMEEIFNIFKKKLP